MVKGLPPNSQGLPTIYSLQRLRRSWTPGSHFGICLRVLFGSLPQFLQRQYLLVLVVQGLASNLSLGQVLCFGTFPHPTPHSQKEVRWGTR